MNADWLWHACQSVFDIIMFCAMIYFWRRMARAQAETKSAKEETHCLREVKNSFAKQLSESHSPYDVAPRAR